MLLFAGPIETEAGNDSVQYLARLNIAHHRSHSVSRTTITPVDQPTCASWTAGS